MHLNDWTFPGWGVVVIAIGVLVTAWLRNRGTIASPGGRPPSSPKQLFRGLCRAHGLTWNDRRLLSQLARFQGLDSPGRLFLEPERFDLAALDPGMPDVQSRYQSIRTRLFAGLEITPAGSRCSEACGD
jgi:hypothetical protein